MKWKSWYELQKFFDKDMMTGTFWNKKRGYDQYMENEYYKMEYKKQRVLKLLRV